MPTWLTSIVWGTGAGAALVLGAAVSWRWAIPPKVVSTVMAFGAGVLISALAFDLVDEAVQGGGLWPTAGGFLAGAVVYVGANMLLARVGAKHRKRSGGQQPSEQDAPGSGTAIAVGALLDGLPESVVLGVGLLAGGGMSPAMLVAVFISNFPEGLSGTAGMKKAGRSKAYVFGLWGGIAGQPGSGAAGQGRCDPATRSARHRKKRGGLGRGGRADRPGWSGERVFILGGGAVRPSR